MFGKSWSACDGTWPGGPRFRMNVYVAMKSEYYDPLKTCPCGVSAQAERETTPNFRMAITFFLSFKISWKKYMFVLVLNTFMGTNF